FLVNVNPDVDTITIFRALPHKTKVEEVKVGRQPSSVAIHPDGSTAYVANTRDGTVSVVDLIPRKVRDTFGVGAEPSALALSPNGTRLYVVNSASNNLVVINTDNNTFAGSVDLSPYGTAPRSIAITNDGDDSDADETIFVAMFYAQLRPGKTSLEE